MRVGWIDTAKGIGIILVVVGHVLRGLLPSHILENMPAVHFIDKWIYSFHMPLFFFLSGLFLVRSVGRSGFLIVASDKIRTIAYPYFVWSILTVLLKASLGQGPNHPRGLSDLALIPIEPIEQFWFLYALFVMALVFAALFAVGARPWIAFSAGLVAYIVPVHPGWSVLIDVRHYAIYFALGFFLGVYCLERVASLRPAVLASAALCGLTLPAIGLQFGLDIVSALAGTAGVIAMSVLLQRAKVLAYLGQHALEIFVAHTVATASVRMLLAHLGIELSAVHLALGIMAGLIIPVMLCFIFKSVGFRYAFTFPASRERLHVFKVS